MLRRIIPVRFDACGCHKQDAAQPIQTGVRLIYFPMEGAGSIFVVFGFEQFSIGNYRERLFYSSRELGGEEIIRMVITGKPIVVVLSFSLRPNLLRLRGIISSWFDESERCPNQTRKLRLRTIGVVVNYKCDFLGGLIWTVEFDSQLLVW